MQVNKYLFCNCAIEFRSDEPFIRERAFSEFLSDFSQADYVFDIIRPAELPAENGEKIFASGRRKVYYDGRTKLYTAYFKGGNLEFVNYACKIDNSELYIKKSEELRETTVFDSINLPTVLLEKGVGILHCSFIEHNGYAILFSGDKQVGKSTQAALWEEYRNAEIINGDRAALTIENGKVFANGIPFCGTSKICKNKKLPLKALVCLSKGTENSLEKLSPLEAYVSIIGKFSYDTWDEKSSEKISLISQAVAETVPVYSYLCLKDKTAVETLEKELLML